MKRIFLGILYLLMLVMMFVYLLLDCIKIGSSSKYGILTGVAQTGLPIIGFIFIIPAFVFTILGLTTDKVINNFLRDMFSFFASSFTIASVIVGIANFYAYIYNYYVPVILAICSLILFVFSLIGVVKAIKNDELKNKNKDEEVNEVKENVEVIEEN